jgi:hypothetical protein
MRGSANATSTWASIQRDIDPVQASQRYFLRKGKSHKKRKIRSAKIPAVCPR